MIHEMFRSLMLPLRAMPKGSVLDFAIPMPIVLPELYDGTRAYDVVVESGRIKIRVKLDQTRVLHDSDTRWLEDTSLVLSNNVPALIDPIYKIGTGGPDIPMQIAVVRPHKLDPSDIDMDVLQADGSWEKADVIGWHSIRKNRCAIADALYDNGDFWDKTEGRLNAVFGECRNTCRSALAKVSGVRYPVLSTMGDVRQYMYALYNGYRSIRVDLDALVDENVIEESDLPVLVVHGKLFPAVSMFKCVVSTLDAVSCEAFVEEGAERRRLEDIIQAVEPGLDVDAFYNRVPREAFVPFRGKIQIGKLSVRYPKV